MKKLVFAVAMACVGLAFSSCGNVEKCYEITVTYTLLGQEYSVTSYARCTKNELKDAEAEVKATLTAVGISEDIITVSSKAVPDTNCE